MTRFVQTIEFKTSRIDDIHQMMDEWMLATKGQRLATHGMETRDRDRANTYVEIVEFPSYEEAMENSNLPETGKYAAALAALCDEPPVFRNLDLVREDDMITGNGAAPSLLIRNFDDPEETRPFEADAGRLDLLNLQAGAVGRATFQPGWRWSEHVKPIAGTDSCQAAHMGYCISGRMKIVMDDGTEGELGPGDFMICPPGHDAWILGDEPCVMIDWQGATDYARRR